MRQIYLIISLLVLVSTVATAQEGYTFTDVKRHATSSVKDQHRSGTCWSWSGLSFLESEAMRMGKTDVPDLSPMFVVHHCYADKAKTAVRMHGHYNFGGGGAFHDVTYCLKNYGIVPTSVYDGLNYGEDNHVHGELDKLLDVYVEAVIANKNKKLSTAWHDGLVGILDAYLGELPKDFDYKGVKYTPKSFSEKVIGINPDDYVEISSYTHHPFYSKFIIEIPDNWLWEQVYNVPMDELFEISEYAIDKGFTIGWAADVSEKGFSHRDGVAIVPANEIEEVAGSERGRWESITEEEMKARMYSFDGPVPEKVITQEMRQLSFDNYQTTDDHGMHIVGKAKDQNGKEYYITKNSWAESNKYSGYLYVSEAYYKYKTMSIMVHKDAIPKNIKKKLGL